VRYSFHPKALVLKEFLAVVFPFIPAALAMLLLNLVASPIHREIYPHSMRTGAHFHVPPCGKYSLNSVRKPHDTDRSTPAN